MSRLRAHRAWLIPLCLLLAAAAVFLCVRLFSSSEDAEEEEKEEAKKRSGWTVMVYMVGSDMEAFDRKGTQDLREMRRAVRGDTTLLVMTGGCPAEEGSLFGADCGIYRVGADGEELLETVRGSMGDPATLAGLLRVGMRMSEDPAALILWDHGFGPMEGFGDDIRDVEDRRLTLAEIGDALRDSGYAERPLTVIGFDACLMAGCETAVTLAPYAAYLLASQETEPGDGWDYGFLEALDPAADGVAFGRAVIDRFTAHYRQLYADRPSDEQPYTLSLIDLSEADELAAAVDAMFASFDRDVAAGRFRDISDLRQGMWGYGRVVAGTEYDAVDLSRLAASAADTHPEALAVQAALDRCCLLRCGNEPDAGGLSVFFPQLAAPEDLTAWLACMDTLPLPEAWRTFMLRYGGALREPPSGGRASADPEDPFRAVLDDTGLRDLARAKFYVLEGTPEAGMRLLYAGSDWSLEDHTVTVRWNGRLLAMDTGAETCPVVSYLVQEDGQTAYHTSTAMVMLEDGQSSIVNMRSARDLATGAWRVFSAIPAGSGDGPESGRREIPLDRIDTVVLYSDRCLPAFDPEGRTLPWPEWAPTGTAYPDLLRISDGFTLRETPLPEDGGPYWIQIVIVDVYNRQYAAPPVPLG